MYIIAVLAGVCVGGVFTYLWLSARLKSAQSEAARLGALEPETVRLRTENASLAVDKARLTEETRSLLREKELIEKNFKDLSSTYQAQFSELAGKILEDKTKGLEAKNSEALRPLTLQLENFVKKVAEMEHQNTTVQAKLEKGLADVIKSTEKIDQSAVHLTNAIKGESIVRGSWGEEALKRILDAAGMKEGIDYYRQVSEDGKRVDVQIALPNDRWIVVDSKTIFNHYTEYFNAQDPKEKAAAMTEHIKDVKNTMKGLSSKQYYKKFLASGDKVQPDYTLMFVNPESALLAAVEAEPNLLTDAWKNNIALVSATSLMSTLKMVSKLWDIDKQLEYMEDLKEDVLKLMKKFNEFLVNFTKAEAAVQKAAEAISVARGKIDKDNGSLLPIAQRIVDVYEAPLTEDNASLLHKAGYAYNGLKSKNAEPEALPLSSAAESDSLA